MDNLEIKPLSMALGVHVIFKPQIVLNIVDFDGSSQVGIFKPRVKNQEILLLRHVDRICMSRLSCHIRTIVIAKGM